MSAGGTKTERMLGTELKAVCKGPGIMFFPLSSASPGVSGAQESTF